MIKRGENMGKIYLDSLTLSRNCAYLCRPDIKTRPLSKWLEIDKK